MKILMDAKHIKQMQKVSLWGWRNGMTVGRSIFQLKSGGIRVKNGSRQSEELPIHRVLDLAILICRSCLYFQDAYRYPKLYDEDCPRIDRVGLQGDAMTIEVCRDNPMIDEDIRLFAQALGQDGEIIGERLAVLSRLLRQAGY